MGKRGYFMEQHLKSALRVRYIKLHFTVVLLEDTRLPMDKVSALRGGMGEMLLRANCIRDRKCAKCDFEPECIVRRTMYSRYDITPQFVTTSDSIGYILECEDYRKDFCKGDRLQFHLILFGKTIIYLSQYMQAFAALGKEGIGKCHSKYEIESVTDTRRRPIAMKDCIHMKPCQIQTLGEYAEDRLKEIQKKGCTNQIVFETPLTLKCNNEFLDIFHMETIWNAVRRRIYMLECYEGIEDNIYDCDGFVKSEMPVILEQVCNDVYVRRYSSTQHRKMTLWGIKGCAALDSLPEDILQILAVGELTHIGKNTSFGFGRYRII